jgi:hypothetical protein
MEKQNCPLKIYVTSPIVGSIEHVAIGKCDKQQCAWYDAALKQCAVLSLAQASRPQS